MARTAVAAAVAVAAVAAGAVVVAAAVVPALVFAQPYSPPPYGPPPYGPPPYEVGEPYDEVSPDGERWQPLVVRPTEHPGIDVIVFRGEGGSLAWLRIVPSRGILRTAIEYDDRPPQIVGPTRSGIIRLDRRARIRQIVLHRRSWFRGVYAVFGA